MFDWSIQLWSHCANTCVDWSWDIQKSSELSCKIDSQECRCKWQHCHKPGLFTSVHHYSLDMKHGIWNFGHCILFLIIITQFGAKTWIYVGAIKWWSKIWIQRSKRQIWGSDNCRNYRSNKGVFSFMAYRGANLMHSLIGCWLV